VWVTGGSRCRVYQENPPMRIYIIGNDGITLCHYADGSRARLDGSDRLLPTRRILERQKDQP
jgi:hypothetical protein